MALQEQRNRYNALGQATNRLFTTGSIAFQALRDSFKNETVQAGAVKASELVRYTSKDIDEPIVPDCVENEELPNSAADRQQDDVGHARSVRREESHGVERAQVEAWAGGWRAEFCSA
mgnify:CR=1 FL=1